MTAAEWLAAIESTQPGCARRWQRDNDGLLVTVHHEDAGGWRVSTVSRDHALGGYAGLSLVEAAHYLGSITARSGVLRVPYVHLLGVQPQRRAQA